MDESEAAGSSRESDGLDFDEDFIRVDAAISEYDSVGNAPQRKGEGAFQWGTIESACLGLLERAKDIRVAIWYIRACLARRGLAGLAESVKLLAGVMSLPADEIHPRASPGESFGEIHALHLGWIAGPLFLHQIGCARFDGKDVTLNALASGDASAILGDGASQASASNVLREIEDSFLSIERTMAVAEQRFDISGVLSLLSRALSRLSATRSSAASDETTSESESVERGHGGSFDLETELATRKDVEVALDRIVEYFRVHEPSHPAPIFLSRIRRMLGAGFEEVMAELYPEGAALAAQLDRPGGVVK
ncbi:ImpA family type VI secretion system protein [Burkholderia stagnalis]|uniref:type VI secretion system protein TssA n=1 Tax=Burkholderia stagnalis TaxID=1503054 RepID=UPI000F80EF07|nr:type VI secretion system ImpA family N-terminal domain-containing protein [Burkholderia stagnalis]